MVEKSKAKNLEQATRALLLALVRARWDPARLDVQEFGMDERDIAYEAGLLSPIETELTVYATQKRGGVLALLRQMREWGWVEFEPKPPMGAYHVFLLTKGQEYALETTRPWWQCLGNGALRNLSKPFHILGVWVKTRKGGL